MARESIEREANVGTLHHAITVNFRNERRGCDDRNISIAPHDTHLPIPTRRDETTIKENER
jgi:hypothetical protein